MKNLLDKIVKTTLLSGLLAGAALVEAFAQGTPGNGGPTPVDIPIDGGASLLVAGGVAFGLKKLRDRRKAR
ncbi:PID-CTERM protein-sorting domain-containing protein [Adhaeribacter soli]|uniref:PID-CTERM protein-sorting domain-containing protein n=1 Tax=Adhaeribacter soli TaxID=2607655 RepID=UPI001CD9E52B|nr:hypothetical protein [Adhaeribacter soli]